VSVLVDFVLYVRLADPYLVLLQVSRTPSTTETPLHFDALFAKFVHREYVHRINMSSDAIPQALFHHLNQLPLWHWFF